MIKFDKLKKPLMFSNGVIKIIDAGADGFFFVGVKINSKNEQERKIQFIGCNEDEAREYWKKSGQSILNEVIKILRFTLH